MASGQEQLNKLEYENQLRKYKDPNELVIRIGLEVYDIKVKCSLQNCDANEPNKKQTTYNAVGASGGILSVINMIILAIQQWLGK